MKIALFGAGKMGSVHAQNIFHHAKAQLYCIVDPDVEVCKKIHEKYRCFTYCTAKEAFEDPKIDAVWIASHAVTHMDIIQCAAERGLPVFCEKPLEQTIERSERIVEMVEKSNIPFLIGFNRRFDHQFATLHSKILNGEIGSVEHVIITSRDPSPPSRNYLSSSGGLFHDMMIHDFDMARWLLGEDPVEIYACAGCLVDPFIGSIGDVDTASVVMKTKRGVLCTINNSRRAAYGYDQRIEVLGSLGQLQAHNIHKSTVELSTASGCSHEPLMHFYLDRYREAYRSELDHFVHMIQEGGAARATAYDGRQALVLAQAALQSYKSGRAMKIESTANTLV